MTTNESPKVLPEQDRKYKGRVLGEALEHKQEKQPSPEADS